MNKILYLIFFISSILSYSQNYLEVGDKFYNHNNFRQAISFYEKESQNKDVKYRFIAIQKLGQTYVKLNEFELAEKWLNEALKINDKSPKLTFQLAEILKQQKKFSEAKTTYLKYIELTKDERFNVYVDFCDSIINWSTNNQYNYEIRECKQLNTAFRDFSALVNSDSIYFVSDRDNLNLENKGPLKNKYSIPNLDFFCANFNVDSNNYNNLSTHLFNGIRSDHHEGPMTFYNNGKSVIFTRTVKGLKTAYQHIHPTQLFNSNYENGQWTIPNNDIKLNNIEYSLGQPCVSKDGETLVYISDEGSNFANTNIYIATWNSLTKNWGQARPLGDHINTRRNELFPFFDEFKNLYFSSIGLPGYGGLDIFFAKYNELKDDWEKPINLKSPINSEFDDYAFYQYGNTSCGFFTSNRTGGTGNDDIYTFSKNSQNIELDYDLVKIEKSTFFSGINVKFSPSNKNLNDVTLDSKFYKLKLSNKDSLYVSHFEKDSIEQNKIDFILEKPTSNSKYAVQIFSHLSNVDIVGTLRDNNLNILENKKLFVFENDVLIDTLITNKDGKYYISLLPDKNYRIVQLDSFTIDLKPKYLKILIYNSKNQLLNNVEVSIKKQNKNFLKFVTNNVNNTIRIPNNSQFNLTISKKYHVSNDTSFIVNLTKGIDTVLLVLKMKEIPNYVLKGDVYEYFKNEKTNVKGVSVEFLNKSKVIDQSLSFENGDFEIKAYPMEKINLSFHKKGYISIDTTFILDTNKIKNVSIELKRITEGTTLQLKEIYFEYNKASLTHESVINLDKIAKFLLANPGIKVELASHTDTRGNVLYNQNLSQKRAESVTKFLIKKGVKHTKLHAVGYGASKPIILNAENEEQHQINRRTEIKILKIDDAHAPDFKYRIVVKTTDKPLDTSDELFEKYPLLKSTSIENGDLIYFVGPYDNVEELKNQYNEIIQNNVDNRIFIEKMLGNTVVENIVDITNINK